MMATKVEGERYQIVLEEMDMSIRKDGMRHVYIKWTEQYIYDESIDLEFIATEIKRIFRERGLRHES